MGIGYSKASAVAFAGNRNEDLLERAFQLAHFIVRDRSAAIEIVDRATKRLTTEQSRERRRIYWRTGSTKQRFRRITRDEQDTLQWLIYLESEKYERQQEQQDRLSHRCLGVRYVKSIMQMTSSMSSFYVAVGLHRILHSYSTPDIQAAYELFTGDFAGAEKYRRVKRLLMQKLATRFAEFLTIRQWDNQELRFDTDENQQEWAGLVAQCLEMFTPWSTGNACLPLSRSRAALLDEFLMAVGGWNAQSGADRREMRRCHILVHPPCFDQLTRTLRLDPVAAKLAMPKFKMGENGSFEDSSRWSSAPPLTNQERVSLCPLPEAGQSQHQAGLPNCLAILADGILCAQLDLSCESRKQWKIQEGTGLIEFCAEAAGTTRILAMHWVDYTEMDGIAAGQHTIALANTRELILETVPADPGSSEAGGATMLLTVSPISHFSRWKGFIPSLSWRPRLPAYALAGVFIVAGWLWSIHRYHEIIAEQQSVIARLEKDQRSAEAAVASLRRQLGLPPPEAKELPTYRLLPDSIAVRGSGNRETPVITLLPGTALARLELPVYKSADHALYRASLKLFSNKTEVLREDLLKAQQAEKGTVVAFMLPSAAVEDRKRYVITLESIESGAPRRLGDFGFYLEKPGTGVCDKSGTDDRACRR
jgi:hypothetical protein